MANDLALRLDREGLAEMSCIAGVGGGVPGLVKLAQSGRPILALDGCRLSCVQACLRQAGVQADHVLLLSDQGGQIQASGLCHQPGRRNVAADPGQCRCTGNKKTESE
jgi:uncharacterized metal-binding protein